MKKNRLNLKKMVITALLVAMNIVLVRYLGITTDLVKFNFGFLPLTTVALLYGPWWGGASFALADIIGMLIAGGGRTYFPLFTVSEFLYGVVYGLILHKREKNLLNISFAVVLTTLVIKLGLTPVWNMLYMRFIMGKVLPYWSIVATRLTPAVIMAVIEIASMYLLWRYAGRYMTKHSK